MPMPQSSSMRSSTLHTQRMGQLLGQKAKERRAKARASKRARTLRPLKSHRVTRRAPARPRASQRASPRARHTKLKPHRYQHLLRNSKRAGRTATGGSLRRKRPQTPGQRQTGITNQQLATKPEHGPQRTRPVHPSGLCTRPIQAGQRPATTLPAWSCHGKLWMLCGNRPTSS